MEFKVFKAAVAAQFELMKKHDLFRVKVEKDDLWDMYLGSFPKNSNPMYRERTEHDCSCCKQFIRSVGATVAIIDGEMESIWDVKLLGEPEYQAVADALSARVKAQPIEDIFLHFEKTAGQDKNFQQLANNEQLTWHHFFINIPSNLVMKGADIPSALNGPRTTHDVMQRGLSEITKDAIDTVLELIAQNSLYRGAEHTYAIEAFRKIRKAYKEIKSKRGRNNFVWTAMKGVPESVSRIRNTVIGTLLVELSEGVDLEQAVKAFEAKVAPTNYKRPTALITQGMIESAKKKLEELGLTSALERRHATIRDITVNNILFADRKAKKAMKGDVFDDLKATAATKTKSLDKVEEVPIEKFIKDILPTAESIEVMLENRQSSNLVSLIAPVDPTAGQIFKWPNGFSWSYNGDLADSIKERVKQAGGNVTGDLCCRLAWFNHDDLDFHMIEPGNYEIYYANRSHVSPSGGRLDVDMNAGYGTTREPVENIFYAQAKGMKPGKYLLGVHNFAKRETTGVGFEVEIDIQGSIHRIAYDKPVKDRESIAVAQIVVGRSGTIELAESLPSSQAVRTLWNIPTQTFHRVKLMLQSPNYWDDKAVGNKHYFFVLDGCINDGSARGFFNEFLKSELDVHRKVFEVVGSKMKVADSEEQLSGLGFSSTKQNAVLCKVKGSFSRVVKVII